MSLNNTDQPTNQPMSFLLLGSEYAHLITVSLLHVCLISFELLNMLTRFLPFSFFHLHPTSRYADLISSSPMSLLHQPAKYAHSISVSLPCSSCILLPDILTHLCLFLMSLWLPTGKHAHLISASPMFLLHSTCK